MTKLKDISDFQEKKGKLSAHQGKPWVQEPQASKGEPAPKKAAKGAGKGKQEEKSKEGDKSAPPTDAAQT